MVNQYTTRGSTMNYRTKKSSDNYFPSELGENMDDPNNSIISLVPKRSDSQLALQLVTPSLHESILDHQINQVRDKDPCTQMYFQPKKIFILNQSLSHRRYNHLLKRGHGYRSVPFRKSVGAYWPFVYFLMQRYHQVLYH